MKIFFYNSKPKIDFFFQNSVQFRRRPRPSQRGGGGGNLGLSESVDPSGFEPLISSLQMRRSTTELRALMVLKLNRFKLSLSSYQI